MPRFYEVYLLVNKYDVVSCLTDGQFIQTFHRQYSVKMAGHSDTVFFNTGDLRIKWFEKQLEWRPLATS